MVVWCDFFSGWISGMTGLIVGHPIDTIKVRQQVDSNKSLLETVKYVQRQGGLAFFRGMGAPLLTNGVMNSVYFGVYGASLDLIVRIRWKEDYSSGTYGLKKHEASYFEHFFAGCIGGVAQLFVGCPVDLVKVQLQSRIQKQVVRGPIDCVKQIVKSYGLFGLYKGIVPQFFRDVPSSGLYFLIYEVVKRGLTNGEGSHNASKTVQFVAGGVAGMISWWSILPLDVIKSRVQGDTPQNPKYKGMIHCSQVIMRTDGIKGFFRGFWPLSLRAFPVNGTTFLVYEYLFRHCRDLHF